MIYRGEITEEERNWRPPRDMFDPLIKEELWLKAANCTHFEFFPTEWIGEAYNGGYMWGGSICHLAIERGLEEQAGAQDLDPQEKVVPAKMPRFVPCKGCTSNCPLLVGDWATQYNQDVAEAVQEGYYYLHGGFPGFSSLPPGFGL